MKLFVYSKINNSKVYLNIQANVRGDLINRFGGYYFSISDGFDYHVNEVIAEAETNSTATGAVLGGLVGLLGGPVGLLVGAGLGGAVGNSSDQSEVNRVNRFNNS